MSSVLVSQPASAAARALRAMMCGTVVLPEDRGYPRACEIWNGAVRRHPALVAVCRTIEDIRAAVLAARAHELPLSVRGGGHDWAGRALCNDGLVIDLSAMHHVEIDPTRRVAKIQGGTRAIDLINTAKQHNLMAVTGNTGSIGMVGLTLGGGYGPLTPRHGLALDNLLAAEVVLGDGRVVKVDASSHTDLLWALRGGGGNFGVVASMSVRMHPACKLLAGVIVFPWSESARVLRRYAEFVAHAPEDLALAALLTTLEGAPVLMLAPVWSGDPEKGEQVISEIRSLGDPMLVRMGPMSYSQLLGMYDAHVVRGRHYAIETRWASELTPDVIALIVNAGAGRTSPLSMIVLHYFSGAGTNVAPNATAFAMRRKHFLIEAISAWEPNDPAGSLPHRAWARNLSQALAGFALPGGYPNLLAPEEIERTRLAYGDNFPQLQELKRRFDPDERFGSAIPLLHGATRNSREGGGTKGSFGELTNTVV